MRLVAEAFSSLGFILFNGKGQVCNHMKDALGRMIVNPVRTLLQYCDERESGPHGIPRISIAEKTLLFE